jgi:hypothetical protein
MKNEKFLSQLQLVKSTLDKYFAKGEMEIVCSFISNLI